MHTHFLKINLQAAGLLFPLLFAFCSSLGQEKLSDFLKGNQLSIGDSTQAKLIKELAIWSELQRSNGYSSYSIDSIFSKDSILHIAAFEGNWRPIRYDLYRITADSFKTIEQEINLENIQYRIDSLENQGYPFARMNYLGLIEEDSLIRVSMSFEKGPRIRYDSLIVKSDEKINLKLLEKISGIKKGALYSEEDLVNLNKTLEPFPYLKLTRNPEVIFRKKGAQVYLFAKKQPANLFNGILGVQPDNATGRVRFTGDLQLELRNAFNQGEEVKLNWKRIEAETQELNVGFELPYLFYSNFNLGASFNLFKQDTTFLNINSEIGLGYALDRNKQVQFNLRRESDNNLSERSDVSSLDLLYYGISFRWNKVDQPLLPRKGFQWFSQASAGTKKIDAVDGESPIEQNTQYTLNVSSNYYLRLSARQGLKLHQKFESIFGNKLYANELFRLGGIHSIRGFDQNSILGSTYALAGIEYRFFLDQFSFVHVFYDQMWYEKNGQDSYAQDQPFGFGAGINFKMNTGVFSFTYALGKEQDLPILIRNGKIHFGYISYF